MADTTLRATGRHAGTHPTRGARLTVELTRADDDHLVLVLGDENHADFWVHVTIPLAEIRKLTWDAPQTPQPWGALPFDRYDATARLMLLGGSVERFESRLAAGKSVARAYAEQLLENGNFFPAPIGDSFAWMNRVFEDGVARDSGSQLPVWLFRMVSDRPDEIKSQAYPSVEAAMAALAAAVQQLW